VATLLVAGAVGAYFLSLEPASDAYDQALVDVSIALGERIRSAGDNVTFDLPGWGRSARPSPSEFDYSMDGLARFTSRSVFRRSPSGTKR